MVIRTTGTQKEQTTVNLSLSKKCHILYSDLEYDTSKPEKTIRDFVGSIREMLAKFEWNKARIVEIEAELNDLNHYMEMASFKTVPNGYKLYRKTSELRKERRCCKNENDLLQPIYEYFHATEVLDRLSKVQGECAKMKGTIDNRSYVVRTDILDEWMSPMEVPKKEDEPKEIIDLSEHLDLTIDEEAAK